MPKLGVFYDIKNIIPDLMDNNGNFRTYPIGVIGKRNVSDYRLGLVKAAIQLILNTNIVTTETKMYISDRYITKRGVNEKLNESREEDNKIPYKTTESKIAYDKAKIDKLLGPRFFTDILMYSNNNSAVTVYETNLLQAMEKYGESSRSGIREAIALDLDKRLFCKKLDDTKFYEFIKDIGPYLKSHMKAVASGLDRESVGYFNYLLLSPVLNEDDERRLKILDQRIKGEYEDPDTLEVE